MAENPRRSRVMLSEKGRFCLRICGGSLKLGVGWKGIRGLGERGGNQVWPTTGCVGTTEK
jgi:hypothetical protein